jgi:hypothetical protein
MDCTTPLKTQQPVNKMRFPSASALSPRQLVVLENGCAEDVRLAQTT